MDIEEQDLINLRNIRFKDTGKIDASITGHPVLIIRVTDTHFYYLSITSSSKKALSKYSAQFFPLKKDKYNKLKAPINYINLHNIYKQEIDSNHVPLGFVENYLFDDIWEALKNYQENVHQDEYYTEIQPNIKVFTKSLED